MAFFITRILNKYLLPSVNWKAKASFSTICSRSPTENSQVARLYVGNPAKNRRLAPTFTVYGLQKVSNTSYNGDRVYSHAKPGSNTFNPGDYVPRSSKPGRAAEPQ